MQKYPPNPIIHGHACAHYQEKIDDVYVDILEFEQTTYTNRAFEVEIQFQDYINGKTMNVRLFTYFEPDFDQMIADAKVIINRLTIERQYKNPTSH